MLSPSIRPSTTAACILTGMSLNFAIVTALRFPRRRWRLRLSLRLRLRLWQRLGLRLRPFARQGELERLDFLDGVVLKRFFNFDRLEVPGFFQIAHQVRNCART